MIIQCENCKTRFKVGDDKLQAGPIKVRCSKCNTVFLAQPAPSGAPAAASPASPATATASMFTSTSAAVAPPSSPSASGGGFGAPQNRSGIFRSPTLSMGAVNPSGAPAPSADPFAALAARPAADPFASLTPRAGQPVPDPYGLGARPTPGAFAGSAPPSPSPTPGPFAGARGADPFANLGPPRGATPGPITAASMPAFNPAAAAPTLGAPSFSSAPGPTPTPPPAASPFGAGSFGAPTPGGAAFGQPFGAPSFSSPTSPSSGSLPPFAPPGFGAPPSSGTPAPFSGGPPRAPTPSTESMSASDLKAMNTGQRKAFSADAFGAAGFGPSTGTDPFGPNAGGVPDPFGLSALSSPPPPPPAPASDPFSAGAVPSATDLFGPGARPATDPFGAPPTGASAPPAPVVDPFAAIDSSAVLSSTPVAAPFAAAFAAPSAAAPPPEAPLAAPSPPSPPPSDGSEDPFAGIDSDADARGLFDAPTKPPAAAPAPAAPTTSAAPSPAPARASTPPAPAAPPSTGADMARVRRLESLQRARGVLWAAAQAVLFAAFLVVAVILGRGGDVEALLTGDIAAAFGGRPDGVTFALDEVRVARRTQTNGVAFAVVTGFVTNRGMDSVPGARVDVRFGDDARVASGWAWSDVDGLDFRGLADAPEALALSARPPKSSPLAPGERAPFVVIAPAPPEDARARIDVVAVKPPPGGAGAAAVPLDAATQLAKPPAKPPAKPLAKPLAKPPTKPLGKPPAGGAAATPSAAD